GLCALLHDLLDLPRAPFAFSRGPLRRSTPSTEGDRDGHAGASRRHRSRAWRRSVRMVGARLEHPGAGFLPIARRGDPSRLADLSPDRRGPDEARPPPDARRRRGSAIVTTARAEGAARRIVTTARAERAATQVRPPSLPQRLPPAWRIMNAGACA